MHNRIKELRRARKITQAKMAADLGVAESTVQNWESSRTEMTGYSLLMVADYLGVPPSEVIVPDGMPVGDSGEGELVAAYRSCSAQGRAHILEYARYVAREHGER